jgi:hypothetical protein
MSRLKKVECVEIIGIGKVPIKEATFRPSGKKKESKMSTCNARDSGHVDTNEPAMLKMTVLSHAYVDAQALHTLDNAQIHVTMAGGHKHLMYPAWSTTAPEEKDGEFELTFESGVSDRIK